MLRATAVIAAAILAGCAAGNYSQLSTDPAVFEQHVRSVSAIDSWEIRARLAFRTGERGGSGSLVWKRDGDTHQVELFGTFGENRISIAQDAGGAVLTDSKGARLSGRTIDELLYARIGWTLPPVDEFQHWIIGLPRTGAAERIKWNQRGYVTSFTQSGWKIRCFDYQSAGAHAFPAQVRVASSTYDPLVRTHRPPGDVQPIEVRLSIRSWGAE